MSQDPLDAGVDFVLDPGLLGFQVDEFDHLLRIHFAQGITAQYIACIGMLAGNLALPRYRQCQLLAKLTHPADLTCWHTHHQGIGWNVLVDYRTGPNEGELTDGHAADDGAVGAKGGAFLHQGVAVLILSLNQ
ncbi:hypothetical protein D9M68_710270 [compost metagenome]